MNTDFTQELMFIVNEELYFRKQMLAEEITHAKYLDLTSDYAYKIEQLTKKYGIAE